MKTLQCLLVAMMLSTGVLAADPPTTSPALTVVQAEKLVNASVAAVQMAKDACQKRLDADPGYHSLSLDMANKLEALETARNQGTTQEKLDAGSAYNLARLKLEGITKKAMQSDAGIAGAEKEVVAARTQLQLATELEKRQAVEAAKAEYDAQQAAEQKKRDDDAPLLTINEFKANAVSYKEKYVKMKVFYKQLTRDEIECIQCVVDGEDRARKKARALAGGAGSAGQAQQVSPFVSGGGGNNQAYQDYVDATKMADPSGKELPSYWVELILTDGNRDQAIEFFASSADLGPTIGKLKTGQPITILGEVHALASNGDFGIFIKKIEEPK